VLDGLYCAGRLEGVKSSSVEPRGIARGESQSCRAVEVRGDLSESVFRTTESSVIFDSTRVSLSRSPLCPAKISNRAVRRRGAMFERLGGCSWIEEAVAGKLGVVCLPMDRLAGSALSVYQRFAQTQLFEPCKRRIRQGQPLSWVVV
jgi:hypothetical protein